MRRILLVALFVFGVTVSAAAQDAVKTDPNHYTVEFEDARVRVLRVRYGPNEKSIMHSHPDAIAIFLKDGRVKFTFPDGKTEERDFKAGQTLFTPATTHLPENVAGDEFELILVELKIPTGGFPDKEPPAAQKP